MSQSITENEVLSQSLVANEVPMPRSLKEMDWTVLLTRIRQGNSRRRCIVWNASARRNNRAEMGEGFRLPAGRFERLNPRVAVRGRGGRGRHVPKRGTCPGDGSILIERVASMGSAHEGNIAYVEDD
jgi:hypothetical protein